MTTRPPDDAMLEIGDIDDDPSPAPETPPVVVIEYRDRGVPWMLIPPLLAAAVVVAVVTALTLNARYNERRPSAPAPASPAGATAAADLASGRAETGLPTAPHSILTLATVPDPVIVESLPPATPADPPAPAAPALVAEATPAVVPVEPPPAGPRVDALGFDPAAFAHPPDVAAPVDRDVAAAQAGRPAEPPPNLVAEPLLLTEVDPALLPPDPTKTRFDRKQREIRARRKLEEQRFEFHAQLGAITKKLGRNAGPAIEQLCKEFGDEIPPAGLDQATKALGKTGLHAGASTPERIALLRQYGFPEAAILGDLVDIEGRHEGVKRELVVRSAMVLLRHPPGRPAARGKVGEDASRPTPVLGR